MPRTLAAAVQSQISSRSRSRGEQYFLNGSVTIVNREPGRVNATVKGESHYDVWLALDSRQPDVDCTCPYFEQGLEPCKHIWAAIRAADEDRRRPARPALRGAV